VWEHCTPNSGPQSSDPTSIKKQKTQQPIQNASDPRSKDPTPGHQTTDREPPRKPQIRSRRRRRGEAEQIHPTRSVAGRTKTPSKRDHNRPRGWSYQRKMKLPSANTTNRQRKMHHLDEEPGERSKGND
jgi:hypothetical protein